MNEALFRTLLFESEGTRLDFKRDTYPFINASDDTKSELLKDLLAFSNAWRTEPAFILIGVGAGPPGQRELRGVPPTDHLDDANLQQFVKGKLNRPLLFSYSAFKYESASFGILEIPVQLRPFYAQKSYGKVVGQAVYYRLGSSTAMASPELVAKMGQDDSALAVSGVPTLAVQFADLGSRLVIGRDTQITVTVHEPHKARDFPDLVDRANTLISLHHPIKDFWRHLATYFRDSRRFSSLGIAVHNTSAHVADDVRLVMRIRTQDAEARDITDMPDYPKSHWSHLDHPKMPKGVTASLGDRTGNPSVTRRSDAWEVEIDFGRIRPRECVFATQAFCISPKVCDSLSIESTCYAANLGEPQCSTLSVRIVATNMPKLTLEHLDIEHNEHVMDMLPGNDEGDEDGATASDGD